MTDRRVLVTGGSGFIGTNLVQHFRDAGVPVASLDLRPPRDAGHRDVWARVDVRDADPLGAAVREFAPTEVVNLAGEVDQFLPDMAGYDACVAGVTNLCAALTAYGGVRRTVFASTRLVCALGVRPVSAYDYCPPNFYGRAKAIGEQVVRQAVGIGEWVIVRPTSIWGPWGREPYRDFFMALSRGRYVHPRGAVVSKHYGYVGNLVHQIDALLQGPAQVHGTTLYGADLDPIEVGAFAALICERMGRPAPRTLPRAVLRAVALAGDAIERTGHHAPLTSGRLANLQTEMLFDLDDLARLAGPGPYSLVEGVDATIAHLRAVGDIR